MAQKGFNYCSVTMIAANYQAIDFSLILQDITIHGGCIYIRLFFDHDLNISFITGHHSAAINN